MKGQRRDIFPGGNTPYGFYSYYNYILAQKEAEKIFCIKGGPGLGKSTLMRKIGNYFLDKGENVDFFWCSSDPDSLDGILIKNRAVAIIDATAPHIVDPKTPGAVDEIINLGEFWNENLLRKNKLQIIECNEKIRGYFEFTYGYLKCALSQYELMDIVIRKCVDEEYIENIVNYIWIKMQTVIEKTEKRGKRKKFFASAITPNGQKNALESLMSNINNIIAVNVPIGFRSELIMKPLADELVKIGLDIEEYYCPMDPEVKIEHLIIPSQSLAIVNCNKYHNLENSEGFMEKIDIKINKNEFMNGQLEDLQKKAGETINKAISMLAEAKNCHDQLEGYYSSCMNFKKIEKLRCKLIDKIEKYQ